MKKVVLAVMVVVMVFVGSAYAVDEKVIFGVIINLPTALEFGPAKVTKAALIGDTSCTGSKNVKPMKNILMRPSEFGTEKYWANVYASQKNINKYNSDLGKLNMLIISHVFDGVTDDIPLYRLTDGIYLIQDKDAVSIVIRESEFTFFVPITQEEDNANIFQLIRTGLMSGLVSSYLEAALRDNIPLEQFEKELMDHLDANYMIDNEAIMMLADYDPEIMDKLSAAETKVVKCISKKLKRSSAKEAYVGIKDDTLVIRMKVNNIPKEVTFSATELSEMVSAVELLSAGEREIDD